MPSLRCDPSHGFIVGGYGILPYPRRPSRGCSGLRCTNRALMHQHCNPPTEFTEFTEASGVEEPPTDFTDAHRWLGCLGFCGKIVWCLRGYGRMPYPPNLCPSVQSVVEYLASETSVGSVVSVGRYFCGCVGMAGMPYPPNLCTSVQSVGEYLVS